MYVHIVPPRFEGRISAPHNARYLAGEVCGPAFAGPHAAFLEIKKTESQGLGFFYRL